MDRGRPPGSGGVLGASRSGATVVPDLGPCLRGGPSHVSLVRRSRDQSGIQRLGPSRGGGERRACRPNLFQRTWGQGGVDLRPTPVRGEPRSGRSAWPRGREGRPRNDLYAAVPRGGHADAGVHEDWGDSLGRLRRIWCTGSRGSYFGQRVPGRFHRRCHLPQGQRDPTQAAPGTMR